MKINKYIFIYALMGALFVSTCAMAAESSSSSSSSNSNSSSSSSSSSSSGSNSSSNSSDSSSSSSDSSSNNDSSNSDSKSKSKSNTYTGPEMNADGSVPGAWQSGGLSSNQVSSGTAKAQEAIAAATAIWGIGANVIAFAAAVTPEVTPMPIINATGVPVVVPSGGPVGWWLNVDLMGLALDAILLNDAMTKKAKWSEDIPELTAAVRQIAGEEELEECEESEDGEEEDAANRDETCNSTNAKLDGTEIHVSTLQNVGLEALEDVAGTILKTPEELLTAAPYIKSGFGTTTTEVTTTVDGKEQTASRTLTTEESEKMDKRKLGHLQFTGTAGVARADLGTTVAVSEKNNNDRLTSYAGSGKSVVANIKVLAGLDLTLAQRLNLLNMIYGQQAANEAASALQLLQNK